MHKILVLSKCQSRLLSEIRSYPLRLKCQCGSMFSVSPSELITKKFHNCSSCTNPMISGVTFCKHPSYEEDSLYLYNQFKEMLKGAIVYTDTSLPLELAALAMKIIFVPVLDDNDVIPFYGKPRIYRVTTTEY